MGASGETYVLYQKVLMQKDFVAEFRRENVNFTRGGLGVTYAIHL